MDVMVRSTAHQSNPYLPHSLRGGAAGTEPVRRVAPPTLERGVPVGTSVQIQDWVGDDPDRATAALQRERERERPRVTLVAHLQNVIRKAAEPAAITAAPAESAAITAGDTAGG